MLVSEKAARPKKSDRFHPWSEPQCLNSRFPQTVVVQIWIFPQKTAVLPNNQLRITQLHMRIRSLSARIQSIIVSFFWRVFIDTGSWSEVRYPALQLDLSLCLYYEQHDKAWPAQPKRDWWRHLTTSPSQTSTRTKRKQHRDKKDNKEAHKGKPQSNIDFWALLHQISFEMRNSFLASVAPKADHWKDGFGQKNKSQRAWLSSTGAIFAEFDWCNLKGQLKVCYVTRSPKRRNLSSLRAKNSPEDWICVNVSSSRISYSFGKDCSF